MDIPDQNIGEIKAWPWWRIPQSNGGQSWDSEWGKVDRNVATFFKNWKRESLDRVLAGCRLACKGDDVFSFGFWFSKPTHQDRGSSHPMAGPLVRVPIFPPVWHFGECRAVMSCQGRWVGLVSVWEPDCAGLGFPLALLAAHASFLIVWSSVMCVAKRGDFVSISRSYLINSRVE